MPGFWLELLGLAVFVAVPWWQVGLAFGVVCLVIVLAARSAGKKSG